MNRRVLFAVAVGVCAVLAAVVIGSMAYQAGVAQGLSQGARLADAPPPAAAYPYPYGHGPFWHFGPFGFLFPLLFVFLAFALVRGVFWRGRCGGYYGPGRGGVPPTFEEWHRRAHEGTTNT